MNGVAEAMKLVEEAFCFVYFVVYVFVPSEVRLDPHSEVLMAGNLLQRCGV